jgi:MFS family permease
LEKANNSDGNACHTNTTPGKPEVDVDEVENATPSNTVDPIRYLNNSRAVRGDDSDGRIAWNVKLRIAACSLMIFYVGKNFSNSHITQYVALTHSRLSDPSLFRIRYTQLHSCRYWGRRKDSLAAGCICFGLASTSPYVGNVQDLVGRREVALGGYFLLCVGSALIGSSKNWAKLIPELPLAALVVELENSRLLLGNDTSSSLFISANLFVCIKLV